MEPHPQCQEKISQRTPALKKLAAQLQKRLDIIGNHVLRDRDPKRHLQELQDVSETIEKIAASLAPTEVDTTLRHYLERRSYSKALDYLREEA